MILPPTPEDLRVAGEFINDTHPPMHNSRQRVISGRYPIGAVVKALVKRIPSPSNPFRKLGVYADAVVITRYCTLNGGYRNYSTLVRFLHGNLEGQYRAVKEVYHA